MPEAKYIVIPDGIADQRADAGLSKILGLSRSACADILEKGGASMNGKLLQKSDRLVAGASLEVTIPDSRDPLEIVAVDIPDLKIIYEDDDLVIIDKPAGVAAHPSVGWQGPTVVGALLQAGIKIATSGASERQGIVQRLDVGTSGLMMVAKSELAYSRLKQAFRDRKVHKVYHAIVQGHPDPTSGTIDAPIDRHPKAEFKFTVGENGKPSVTHYEMLEAFGSAALLEIVLETGRTHQIRVHFSAFRHPAHRRHHVWRRPKVGGKVGHRAPVASCHAPKF